MAAADTDGNTGSGRQELAQIATVRAFDEPIPLGFPGEVSEWLKERDWKSRGRG
jgi:hypothetical protein